MLPYSWILEWLLEWLSAFWLTLLPGGGTAAGGKPPPKDEKGAKEWLRNKLKVLASLLGRLGVKAVEALPDIIGTIISWILNIE